MKRLRQFLIQAGGATAVEYAMLAALIGVVVIGGAGALGTAVNTKFQGIRAQVTAAP